MATTFVQCHIYQKEGFPVVGTHLNTHWQNSGLLGDSRRFGEMSDLMAAGAALDK